MNTEQLIHDLKQLGKYSELEPNYLLLAAEKIEELSGNQIKTNYDRIRNMSIDELAKFIPDWSYTKACKCDEEIYADCNNECWKCVKEWLESEVQGGMKSALMLGVNPNAEREENDFYATNPKALEIALPKLEKAGLSKNVWECACGEGHLSEVLKKKGYKILSTDKVNRGYGAVADFLTINSIDKYDMDILTNPPFKLAEKFVEKGMDLITNGHRVFLFLKVQFLESKGRYDLFKKYPLKQLLVYSERQQCAKNAEFEKYTATTQCYCWFVFEKGYDGKPTIDWII